jgi:dUTP pyrophosphatase
MPDVRIVRLNPSVALPRFETAGAAGFDLAASADVTVEPGQIALIPTGLVIEVPAGHFLGIFARSSTPLKRGLVVANGVGVVDSDYCGPADEIRIQVLNVTTRPVSVRRGDRIAQGVVVPFVRVEWNEQPIDRPTRGGFGATERDT